MKTISSILILAAILFAVATADAQEIITAATAGNLEKVKELVVANPQVVNVRDSLSRTPLHWACRGVHFEVLKYLFGPEYQGGSPFIAPDGSYIIFNSMDLPGSFGSMDLYIGYKNPDGTWTKPVNMGPSVNSSFDEILPMVSRDGKYLFMRTKRNGISGVYWMDAKIIEELKQKK